MNRFYLEYQASLTLCLRAYELPGNAFYSLLLAAAREAGSDELERLESSFPEAIGELRARHNAPGGRLPGEKESL